TASAKELREDLERWLAGERVHARRETLTQRVTRFARRSPRMAVSAAAILTALGLGAFVLVLATHRAQAATREVARLERQEEEQLSVARDTAKRLLTDVYQIVSRYAGTEDLSRRLVNMGIEVASSTDGSQKDPELSLWLADALVKRGASSNDTSSWRPALAHACLQDTARALELVMPLCAKDPERFASARVSWEAPLVSSLAYFNLCDIDSAREMMATAKARVDAYQPPEGNELLFAQWMYARERVRFIESAFEGEYGQFRLILRNCNESLELFEVIERDSTHLGLDELSRLHRLQVMQLTLSFLAGTERGAARGEPISDSMLALLDEARGHAEAAIKIAEDNPTQELMLGRAADAAERLAFWWIRIGRTEDADALLQRALRLMKTPGLRRRHSALVILTALESSLGSSPDFELPEVPENLIGAEAAALLFLQRGQLAIERGDPLEATRLAARSLALLDTNSSSCPERAEHRRARGELELLQARVELSSAETAVGEARRRHLKRAEARFVAGLTMLESTGGDDLYMRKWAPVREAANRSLVECRHLLDAR
ncbi:MAG: hypothetical protein AAGG01_19060, partial [Planctomycetota bacterium]